MEEADDVTDPITAISESVNSDRSRVSRKVCELHPGIQLPGKTNL